MLRVPLGEWLGAAIRSARSLANCLDLGAFSVLESSPGAQVSAGAFVGLTSEEESLQIGIMLTPNECLHLASRMAGVPLSAQSDAEDALGELANILVGGVKRELRPTIPDLVIGLPTFVTGSSHKIGCQEATAHVRMGDVCARITVQLFPSAPEIQQQRRMERELRSAHDEVRATSEFLQDTFRAMPGCLVVANAEGIIEAANDATFELFLYRREELVGKPLSLLFVDPAGAPALPGVDPSSTTTQMLDCETDVRTREGKHIPVLYSRTAIFTPDRLLQRVIYVLHDARARKKLEVELRQTQKLEAIGRLAAGIAHEINTPTQFVSDSIHFVHEAVQDLSEVVAAFKELLHPDENPSAREEIARIEEQYDVAYLWENIPLAVERSLDGLGRIETIVRSMKEFAHPDNRDMTESDLNQAIRNTLVIANNEYKYVADLDVDLGPIPPVTCYVSDLNQAFLNILVNAAHAVAAVVGNSGRRGRIAIRTRREEEHVTVSIRDSGCGIPVEVRDRIFDPFFTTKDVGQGTGQGLSIARAIVVDKHGGELKFETEVGKGTTFYLRLPIAGRRTTSGPPRGTGHANPESFPIAAQSD